MKTTFYVWIDRLLRRRQGPEDNMKTELMHEFLQTSGGRSLAWLADAPLFIDSDQVAALYNAVVRPEHRTGKLTLSLKDAREFKVEGKAAAKAELGLAEWIKTMFPFLAAKAELGIEGSASAGKAKEEGSELELLPIDTPQRQLVQLALHYFLQLPHRQKVVTSLMDSVWLEDTWINALPRGLVFVEFPAGTKFMPTAAEFDNGKIKPIYPSLIPEAARGSVPAYPEPSVFKGTGEELAQQRKAYWEFFGARFNSSKAMEAIETQASDVGGKIRWIDYRVPLDSGTCLHIDIAPRGSYDTGTFAYRFVKRGYKHGLRVVGTMKSEPAMNVLAIFER